MIRKLHACTDNDGTVLPKFLTDCKKRWGLRTDEKVEKEFFEKQETAFENQGGRLQEEDQEDELDYSEEYLAEYVSLYNWSDDFTLSQLSPYQ